MIMSDLPFAKLQSLLLELGFDERLVDGKYRGFYHADSDTLFTFRPYGPHDLVSAADVVTVRKQLAWRGLLSEAAFEASMSKVSA
jgi:hypothetical protein